MTTLQFVDTHNLVAFLTKSIETEGFKQIVDFLNASSIKYALTVNTTIYTSCIEQFWSTVKAKTVNGEVQLQALVDGKKIIITEATVRRDLQLEDANGVDCLPNATIFEQLTLMGYEKLSQKLTFYKAFFSPQWKFLIHTILQCLSAKTTAWNEFSSTMASVIICLATNQKFNFSKYIFESMVKNLDNAVKFLMYPRFVQVFLNNQLEGMATHNRIYIAPSHTKKLFANMRRQGKDFSSRVTPLFPIMVVQAQEEMGEDEAVNEEPSMQLKELMDFCTKLQQRVLDLEKKRYYSAMSYKVGRSRRVVSSEEESLGDQKDASKQRRIHDIDADKDIYLVNVHKDEDIFGLNDLEGDEIVVESEVADKDEKGDVIKEPSVPVSAASTKVSNCLFIYTTTAATTITAVSSRPRAKGIVFHEQEQAPTLIVFSQQPTQVKDKGKGNLVKEEPVKKMSKKELLNLDKELAFKLQAKKDEKERLVREKAQKLKEANIAWDDIQAKVKADYQLAQRLQAQEQEELSDAEKATLFIQLLEKRRKHFAAKRAEEKRNTPPTKAQQRSFMYTYLKNMEGWKPKDLKNKSFANIQDLFDKAMKRVNTFVAYGLYRIGEESSKKAEIVYWKESTRAPVDYECEMAFAASSDLLVTEQLKEKLVLLVQKLLLLVLKVNAAGIKVTTAERLQLLKG
ncbi:hypothetical protein Tco_1344049 [Tanacetum coccineum]